MAPGLRTADPRAPDGGWGWWVVFASFVQQALSIGVTYTFGVLLVDLLRYFDEKESTTAWIGSIQPCLLYFTGIVASPFIKKFGWRVVSITGSVLSAVGFATSALAPNVYTLYFTYGVLTGLGNGLMYVTSMVAVQHYFSRRRAMATGLAVAGSGVGTLFFGFVTPELLRVLHWRWTLVVEGGILLIGAVVGLLFRPLPELTTEHTIEEEQPIMYSDKTDSIDLCGSLQKPSTEPTPSSSASNDSNAGSMSCQKLCPTSEVFDPEIAKNPIFIVFCGSLILFCFGYHVPYTYTPERAVKVLGQSEQNASMLVSFMGIANVVSRLLFGWLADRNESFRFFLGATVLTLGGVVSALMPLFSSYSLMIVYSALFGMFTGCWVAVFPVLLVDLLGIDRIERSLGMCMGISSFAFLVAAPISGWIINATGHFDLPFIIVGIGETIGGILFFSIRCILIRRRRSGYSYIATEQRATLSHRSSQHYLSESFS
ncbi:Monocarboxylate transporter 12 [Lamellibrachia satsuma]|nr:Monocarboxylate transporter 12 [Lamellibrachia satsuma]